MKVEIALCIEDIEEETIEYCLLSNDMQDEIIWKKTDEYPAGPDYELEIVTDNKMKKILRIKSGDHIVTSIKDIRELFLNALLELDIIRQTDEADGFEHVHDSADDFLEKEVDPYDPKLIRVDPRQFAISYVETLISSGDLDLSPDFQREFVWTDITRKSRLIESLMLRIPLPVFYLAQDSEGLFKVVDGVQRLTVIHAFLNNEFKLKNLEYLKELEGRWFKKPELEKDKSIPPMYSRRIEQTQLYFNIIDPQAPESVKYDIFKRINTGGKTLNAQEIRNCLSNIRTRKLFSDMVSLESFQKATKGSISSTRMADKEIALRFVAFYLLDEGVSVRKEYKGGMDLFLDETNERLNKMSDAEHKKILHAFDTAMENAYLLFGERAFRKADYINKSLFLSMSRILYHYQTERLVSLNLDKSVLHRFEDEITNNNEYNRALSMATNDARNVNITFSVAKEILEDFLND